MKYPCPYERPRCFLSISVWRYRKKISFNWNFPFFEVFFYFGVIAYHCNAACLLLPSITCYGSTFSISLSLCSFQYQPSPPLILLCLFLIFFLNLLFNFWVIAVFQVVLHLLFVIILKRTLTYIKCHVSHFVLFAL